MVKIEDNGIVQPKTKKEARGGDDKWKLKHLDGQELEERFTLLQSRYGLLTLCNPD